MEDIRYKKIKKVVGYNSKALLEVNLEIQTNHIKFSLCKIRPKSIKDFVYDFNQMSWKEKLNCILDTNNLAEGTVIDITEKEIREEIINFIYDEIDFLKEKENWIIEDEDIENLKKYKGKSMPLVEWLSTFSNKILDGSVIAFAPDIIRSIEGLKTIPEEIADIYSFDEYVLYMGPNEKYRGCLGLIDNFRENDEASTLISFPGTKKASKGPRKLWCNDENLLSI